MNGFSLVVYVKDYESATNEELSNLYYRFSNYCLEHILNYELIVLTPSSIDVSNIAKYFKSINIKNNIRVYNCDEKFIKVAEFMITIGYYNTQILIDFVNYSKSTVGIELMLSDFIKYESPCCIGLYKDNNACSDGIVGIVFNRSYLYKDVNYHIQKKLPILLEFSTYFALKSKSFFLMLFSLYFSGKVIITYPLLLFIFHIHNYLLFLYFYFL